MLLVNLMGQFNRSAKCVNSGVSLAGDAAGLAGRDTDDHHDTQDDDDEEVDRDDPLLEVVSLQRRQEHEEMCRSHLAGVG